MASDGYRWGYVSFAHFLLYFIMPAVRIPITILRLPDVESGRRPIMKKFNFTPVYLFLYMYESANANFDGMGASDLHDFFNACGKPWKSEKRAKLS